MLQMILLGNLKNAHALILLSINSYLIENVCENTKGHVRYILATSC